VAADCKKEKDALDEAKRESNKEEREWGRLESKGDDWEAAANRTLDGLAHCEGDIDCITTRIWLAERQFSFARGYHNLAEKHHADFLLWDEVEEHRKDKYCDCLNRQSHR
jgi:hypothetical protein